MDDNKAAPEPISPLPQPTLPKGGGAIRDIGEKFTTSAATGTGQMSVPIYTSPGRGGFHPELSLGYDSGRGNGPFGIGWSLSVPQIARKTDKGLPRYLDSAESDVFILSGAEDLVPALTDSGAPDELVTATTRARRYRPRVEGLFARIERITNLTSGEISWRVITKDNVQSTYGATAASRIADSGDPKRVFTWLLDETRDGKGNIIAYEYKQEDQTNRDPTVGFERVRPIANTYLKRIYYGNQTLDTPSGWHFQVVFDYGEHDASTPTPAETQPWPARLDPFSTFRSTFEIRTYRLCQRVLMFHSFAELGTDWQLVRSTDFVCEQTRVATYLRSATQKGYLANQLPLTLPAVEFDYSRPTIEATLHQADARNLPYGIDERHYRLIDLDGEGIQGVLTEQGEAWFYARNLGQGRFAAANRLRKKPSIAALGGGVQQLLDLDGSGTQSLVQLGVEPQGSQKRTDDGFAGFKRFKSMPNIDWQSPNLRMLDIDGDGLIDVLITEDRVLAWHPSLGKDGYGPRRTTPRPSDEDKGPAIVFADAEESIHVADMTGDGLHDIVRVRNGSVCYWPNLGYGRFGARVVMRNAPRMDSPDAFDPARVRLADVDGSGTTDLLYLKSEGIRLWFNESGNGYSSQQLVATLPRLDNVAAVTVTDLLGKGTACVVWSSPLPGTQGRALRYLDLMSGVKPHLLTYVKNNLGLETTIEYQSSTEFYLQDRAAGTPWITKLPFPVQVVSRITANESVSGSRLVSTYRYHHGYYDGVEREFRGFGMVEHQDAETFDAGATIYTPPSLTKTWFHTGVFVEEAGLTRQYTKEYWAGDPLAPVLPDTALPRGLEPDEVRQAARALHGQTLRQEIYGLDGLSSDPYSVTEANFTLVALQRRGPNRHASFFAHARETIALSYEREPADPRLTHELTLEVDDFGSVRKSVSIAYPRRQNVEPFQDRLLATYRQLDVVNVSNQPDWYRTGVPYDTQSWQLLGLTPPASGALAFADVAAFVAGPLSDVPLEQWPLPVGPARRALERTQTIYWNDALTAQLALGTIESRALPATGARLAFTDSLIRSVWALPGVNVQPFVVQAGYQQRGVVWWAPIGQTIYSAVSFYQATQFIDALDNPPYVLDYDPYALLPARTVDPVGNETVITNDYRALEPSEVRDPNLNRTQARHDALGRVIATAVMGKAPPATQEGDTLDAPTMRLEYVTTQVPAYVHVSSRETHGDPNTRWQESYTYSDGLGREAMKKVQAEPDSSGAARWVGTGRTVFDNKGNPVRKYEPFFSADFSYEPTVSGVSDLFHYDPLNRLVRTDHPNGTFARVEHHAWYQLAHDESDTVIESDWRNRPNQSTEDQRATANTLLHRHTPTRTRFDALGRTVATISNNTVQPADTSTDNPSLVLYETRLELDIQGNQRTVWDARAIAQNPTNPPFAILTATYDLLGRVMSNQSADAGPSWLITDVLDTPCRKWDGRGMAIFREYDGAHRTLRVWAGLGNTPSQLMERTIWGEGLPTGAAVNLRGRAYQQLDTAGLVTNEQYDFKGNLLAWNRRMHTLAEIGASVDYAAAATTTLPATLPVAVDALFDTEAFRTQFTYDALNRVTSKTTPDASVTVPAYNEAGLLETISLNLQGNPNATPFVTNIDYNEKGQRILVTYGAAGGGVTTTYAYDPLAFRMTSLRTVRGTTALQDLSYTYDPVGNITEIVDAAQQTIFFASSVVEPRAQYTYDPTYRLTDASGREHAGQSAPDQVLTPTPGTLLDPNVSTQMRRYTEHYDHDESGNLTSQSHKVTVPSTSGSWTRTYQIAADSNRLASTTVGSTTSSYTYDTAGNAVAMPHLPSINWTFKSELSSAQLVAGPDAGARLYCEYDAKGERARKSFWTQPLIKDRYYLDGYEVYREHSSAGVFERQTLHVHDGQRRVALVETRPPQSINDGSPRQLIRYQLDNHLGSATLELDDAGDVVSYEEYHPYGTTAYRATTSALDKSPKRYAFTAKERDENTGFYYHGARYYAPWLGRWTNTDPQGMVDGPNLYAYVRDNPIVLSDPNGTQSLKDAYNAFVSVNRVIARDVESKIRRARVAVSEIAEGADRHRAAKGTLLDSLKAAFEPGLPSVIIPPNLYSEEQIRAAIPPVHSYDEAKRARKALQSGDFATATDAALSAHDSLEEAVQDVGAVIGAAALLEAAPTAAGERTPTGTRPPSTPKLAPATTQVRPGAVALRVKYIETAQELGGLAERLQARGMSAEQVVRTVSPMRNELKLNIRAQGSWFSATAADARNVLVYGNRAGPSPERLLRDHGSWEKALDAISHTNRTVNRILGVGR